MKAKNFKLFMGCLGNGVTVCNSAVYENGDYKTIAHISNAGNIKLYVDPDYIPADDMKRIEAAAAHNRSETETRIKSILEMKPGKSADYERGRILDEICNYTHFENWHQLFKDMKSTSSQEEKNKLILEYYLKHF